MRFDLHIHSCLSPCASLEMAPSVIPGIAKSRGIGIVSLTDHNAVWNCPAMEKTCREAGIGFIPGMEAQSAEEVHLLCYFRDVQTATDFGREYMKTLPRILNDPEKTGDQAIVNEFDEVEDVCEFYLGVSSVLGIEDIRKMTREYNGICLPAHVDRGAFSMLSQLGFLPDLDWPAVEAIHDPPLGIDTGSLPVIGSSDAHYPGDIGKRWTRCAIEPDNNEESFTYFLRILADTGYNRDGVMTRVDSRSLHLEF